MTSDASSIAITFNRPFAKGAVEVSVRSGEVYRDMGFENRMPAGNFVGRKVIHDNDVSRFEFGHRKLFDIGLEGGIVHGTVQYHGRDHSGEPQPGGEGGCFPMPVGDTPTQNRAAAS